MDDWRGVDIGDSHHDAITKFLPGADADVPKKGTRHLAEQGLHDIEPRPMLRREYVLKAVGASSQEGLSFFGNMRGMVIRDNSNGAHGRIVLVQILEQRDEFATAMPALNAGRDMALVEIQRRQNGTGSKPSVFMIASHLWMFSGHWRQVRRGMGDGLKAGLFIHRNGNDRKALTCS